MISNRIHLLRTIDGISRNDLAQKVGVNFQTIGFIERGDYLPSLELAFKIAEVFNVEITEVFNDQPFQPIIKRRENVTYKNA